MTTTNTYGRQVVVPLTNKSGGSVAAGDVVIVDTGNNDAFTTTTTGAFTASIGVAQEAIANNATGRVLLSGYAALVNVNASVTRGNFAKTHTVAKQATDAGASRIAGTFGIFLTGGTTPDALIWQPDLGAGSGLTDPMTTRGDIIVRNSSNVSARLAVGSANLMSLKSDGTDPAWGILPGTLLAHKVGTSDVTTTSATFVDADATNLAVTFTAPPSTNVLVRLTGMMSPSAGGAEAVGTVTSWGLRESTSNIAGTAGGTIVARVLVSGATVTDIRYVSAAFVLTGISAGSHTYKWAFATSAGTTKLYGATDIMEVWALA